MSCHPIRIRRYGPNKMSKNQVKVWLAADLYDAEMLKGAYVRHSYPWHSHEDISLGLVVDGAIELRTRTSSAIAGTGSVVLINTEEVHQGGPAVAGGWRCRTIHINPAIIRRLADGVKAFTSASPVVFRGPAFEDPKLARDLLQLHRMSETPGSALDRQSRIVAIISQLLSHHANNGVELPKELSEPGAVRKARAFLDENLSEKVTLEKLALVSGLPPFRLLRTFQRTLGLTPHDYQIQARVRVAHKLLRRNDRLADVAVQVGFSDQAHLTRVFKSIMGATPGQYRAAALAG